MRKTWSYIICCRWWFVLHIFFIICSETVSVYANFWLEKWTGVQMHWTDLLRGYGIAAMSVGV